MITQKQICLKKGAKLTTKELVNFSKSSERKVKVTLHNGQFITVDLDDAENIVAFKDSKFEVVYCMKNVKYVHVNIISL